jgi:uncharacterized protein YdcH (DUF465 family)
MDVNQEILEQLKKMNDRFNVLDDRFNVLDDRFNVLDDRFNVLERKQDKLQEGFDRYKPIFEKAGYSYELLVRRELCRIKGEDYGRCFVVDDLVGLARVSFPKHLKVDESGSIVELKYSEIAENNLVGGRKLAEVSLQQLKGLQDWR